HAVRVAPDHESPGLRTGIACRPAPQSAGERGATPFTVAHAASTGHAKSLRRVERAVNHRAGRTGAALFATRTRRS
ncbi:MAG: hypothetical protein KDF63_16920, partial [Rhodoferax sp.]|nr:hypothetical protein [Rhodoferax sp.]